MQLNFSGDSVSFVPLLSVTMMMMMIKMMTKVIVLFGLLNETSTFYFVI